MPIRTALAAILMSLAGVSTACAQPMELGFLGPRGTYSEQAAEAFRAGDPKIQATKPLPSITAVVEAVAKGEVQQGIVPAVATVSGFPAETSRLLFQSADPGVRIIGEVTIRIDSYLLAKPGTKLVDVKRILSHPNALKEAAAYLKRELPDVPLEETRSTAAAAQAVAEGDGTTAAVAGPAAARLFGLGSLADRIQDDKENATSFWAVTSKLAFTPPPEADRLVFLVDAPPGSPALSRLVRRLWSTGLSIVHVNSAPLPGPIMGFRYVALFAAEKPLPVGTLMTALKDAAKPEAPAPLLLGAYVQR